MINIRFRFIRVSTTRTTTVWFVRVGEYFSAGIATSVKSYKTNGQEMSAAISSLGATATSANIPFSEQLAILGQLQATMSGSEAATKYAAFINSAAGAGEKLGLNFLDANDQLR
ncbi:phage tail tape measure protein, partial [Vibrio parahaemolyticus]|nr:phage tail tape measure protein [Vibrio parahaemolyticus]